MKRGLSVVILIAAAITSCFAGTTYTFTTLTEAEGAKSATHSRVWTSGGSLKMLFVQSDEPSTPVSSYVLRQARSGALYLVYPDKKSYFRWNPQEALQANSSRFEVLESHFEKVSETPGEAIAGFPTTHYKFRLTYTMKSEVFGQTAETPVSVEQEYWVADNVRLNDIKSANLMQSGATGMSMLDPELQRAITEQTAKLRGTPLKTVMRFIVRLPAREQVTTMTSEISEVKAAVVPAATFRIPLGYRRITPPKVAEVDDPHEH